MGGTSAKGFTLLELMMALAVAGVVLAIAIPNFNAFRLNARMTSAANDLLGGLNVARSEAIKRQQPVALCGSATPNASPPACSGALTGWVVWVDTNNDGAIAATEQVVARHEPLSVALGTTTNGTFVSYAPTGFVQRTMPGAASAFKLCDQRNNDVIGDQYRKRIVAVSATGRPAILRVVQDVVRFGAQQQAPPPPINVGCP